MAKFVNELTLDTRGFQKGIADAVKIASQIPAQKTVQVTANATGAQSQVRAVGDALNQIASKEINITADAKAAIAETENLADKFEEAAAAAGKINTVVSGLQSGLAAAGNGVQGFLSSFTTSITAGGIAGIVSNIAGQAIDAIKNLAGAALDEYKALDKNIANIATLGVEESGKSLQKFQELIVDLSTKSPDTAANIANGVYNAISAGITGTEEEIVKFVETASQVAVAGLSDTNAAVNGLTSVVNAYGKGAEGAKEASNIFFAAIKAGKTSFNELNAGLAQVLPTASGLDVNFQTLAGSIAKLTTVGIPTAQAATTLNAAFTELQKPGKDLANVLQAAGLDVSKMSEYLKDVDKGGIGFVGVLEKVKEGAEKTGKTIGQAFSSSEAAKAVGALTKDLDSTKAILEGIQKDVDANVADKAFESASKSIDVNLGIIKNNFLALFFDIIDIPKKIGAEFSKAFGGEGGGGIFQVITDAAGILRKVVGLQIERLIGVFKIVANVFAGIKDAVLAAIEPIKQSLQPVIDLFDQFFGGAGEGIDIWETLSNVIKLVTDIIAKGLRKAIEVASIPLKLLGQLIGFLITKTIETIKWIRDTAKAVYDWANSFEFVRVAIAKVVEFVTSLIEKAQKLWGAVKNFLGITGEEAAETTEAIQEVAQATDAATDATDKNTDATKKNAKANNDLQKELAALAKQILDVQRARAKAQELFDAGTIADDIERERKRLEIEKRFQDEAFAEELRGIKGNGVLAVKQRELINEKKLQSDEEYQRKVIELERKTGEATLRTLLDAAKQREQAASAILESRIKQSDEQIKAGNLSADNARKGLEARIAKLNQATQKAADAIVEATDEFKRGEQQILFDVKVGKIDAETGLRQIAELRKKIEKELLAVPGDSDIAQRLRLIYQDAEKQAAQYAKELDDQIRKQQIALIQDDTLRKIEETVFALEQQRDLLLKNLSLTDSQRAAIVADFDDKIAKARTVVVNGAAETFKALGKKLGEIQFDLSGVTDVTKQAKEQEEAAKKIAEAVRSGNKSYAEAVKELSALEQKGTNVFANIAKAIGKDVFKTAFKASLQAVEESINSVQELERRASIAKIAIAEEEANKIKEINASLILSEKEKQDAIAAAQKDASNKRLAEDEKVADGSKKALESIGLNAGIQFAKMVAEGESASDAIKAVAADVVGQLLKLYTPSIIGLISSVIPPPFAQVVAGALISSLQALLKSALSGFREGGYTGEGTPSKVVGVVHAREFVMPERLTLQNRKLFDHIYSNKPLSAFPALQKAMRAAQIIGATNAIEATRANAMTQPIDYTAMNAMAVQMDRIAHRLESLPDESFAHHRHMVEVDVTANDSVLIRKMQRNNIRRARS